MGPASNKIVSVIIVTCARSDYLQACLDSLKEQTFAGFEMIVIDNSCSPGFSREVLRRNPRVNLFSSPENLSYCQSLNRGIRMSCGAFILCLNDDVVLDKNYLHQALTGFDQIRVGMVGGKILRSDKATLDTTGLFLRYWRTAGERGYGKKDRHQFEQPGYIFGTNGAVAFYRRQMLEEIKEGGDYFDEDFRFFYEDLDLAWRAHKLGWKGYYVPSAIAYHLRGGSVRSAGGQDRPFARRFLDDRLLIDLIKNRYLVLVKHESLCGFFVHLPGIVTFELLNWGYILCFRTKLIKFFLMHLGYLGRVLKEKKK